jgi:hypothetical protein
MADHNVQPSGDVILKLVACWRSGLPTEFGRPTTPVVSAFPGLRERVLAAEARRIR